MMKITLLTIVFVASTLTNAVTRAEDIPAKHSDSLTLRISQMLQQTREAVTKSPCITADGRPDFDCDSIADEIETQLAEKYKPLFIFHPGEEFYFIDPTTFITSTGAQLNAFFAPWNEGSEKFVPSSTWSLKCGDNTWYPPSPQSFPQVIGLLNSNDIHEYPEVMECVASNGWDDLIIAHPAEQQPGLLYYHLDPEVPVFYLVEKNAEDNLELQFWVFSYYNHTGTPFNVGDHWGDWMHMSLVFQMNGTDVIEPPLYVYYAAHSIGAGDSPYHPRYLMWEDVNKYGTTHPIAMVARNTHELYFQTNSLQWPVNCDYSDEEGSTLYFDGTCATEPFYVCTREIPVIGGYEFWDHIGMGQEFLPQVLVNLGNGTHPNPGTWWMKFGGHWGTGNWTTGGDGPLGLKANVPFRQHCICTSANGDMGSMEYTYWRLMQQDAWDDRSTHRCWTGFIIGDWRNYGLGQVLLEPLHFYAMNSRYGGVGIFYVDGTNQDFQNGTIPFPYKTVTAASGCRTNCPDTIFVKPGHYPETIYFNEPEVLMRWWGTDESLSIVV